MRKIKFRGKSLETGEWVKGNLFYDKRGGPYIAQSRVDKYFIESKGAEWWDMDEIEVDPETIGQFAEFTATNGDELYDGDLFIDEDDDDSLWICKYTDHLFTLKNIGAQKPFFMNYIFLSNEYSYGVKKIVGNVWDNPELLKE